MSQTRMWAAALACVVAIGCKDAGGKTGAAGKPAEAGAEGTAVALSLYVFCFNELEPRVRDSWNSYVEWVDPKTGPTGKEKRIDGIRSIDDYRVGKCKEQLEQAVAKGVAAPLGDQTKAVLAALPAMIAVVDEARTYYDQKNYKDDGFAKGRELHGKLTAAFDAYRQAFTAMKTTWETQHRANRDKELAAVEKKHGRKSVWFVTSLVMNRAEEMIEVALAKATPDEMRGVFAKYQAAYDELAAAWGPVQASEDTDKFSFKRDAEELLTQVKEAGRALAAGKPLPEDGDGSAQKLLDEYNTLVETSNSCTWDR